MCIGGSDSGRGIRAKSTRKLGAIPQPADQNSRQAKMLDNILIIGSGMAAAGACYALKDSSEKPIVVDKNDCAGGHTATCVYPSGFLFDQGPHVSFTKD